MIFCDECGRNQTKINCIHQATLSQTEKLLIMMLVTGLPIGLFVLLPHFYLSLDRGYLLYGYLSVMVILVLFTFFGRTFKRPYLPYFFHCHQHKHRSLTVLKTWFPLCARCLGIVFGSLLTFVLIHFNSPWYFYLLSGLPLIIDGLFQQYSDYQSTNQRRFLTGLLFGPTFVFAYSYVMYLFIQLLNYLNPFL